MFDTIVKRGMDAHHRLMNWRRNKIAENRSKNGGVFSLPDCIFKYCPHPSQCCGGKCANPNSRSLRRGKA